MSCLFYFWKDNKAYIFNIYLQSLVSHFCIQVPADLVIDHSVTSDGVRSESAVQDNMELEFERNKERFACLKWGSSAFYNMLIIPPGSGIVHQVNINFMSYFNVQNSCVILFCCLVQVNLEYLDRDVFNTNGLLYPDSVVGTDSHTTMINGLGILGWGVGGIDAEAAMLGQVNDEIFYN